MKSFVVHRAVTFLLLMTVGATATADESSIAISAEEGSFHVSIGDEPFCDVDFRTYEKPIVYPIFGPGQVPMTRNYPMQKGVPNEATDHPHHKSMWFGHGDVNGVSFWHGEGKIVNESAELIQPQDGPLTIRLISQLLAPQGELVGRETMELSFARPKAGVGSTGTSRFALATRNSSLATRRRERRPCVCIRICVWTTTVVATSPRPTAMRLTARE